MLVMLTKGLITVGDIANKRTCLGWNMVLVDKFKDFHLEKRLFERKRKKESKEERDK